MLGLLAQCMFEATRIAPFGSAAAAKDWRSPSGRPGRRAFPECRESHKGMAMDRYQQRLTEFARLHRSGSAFLMPNAWDAGTARILEGLGFKALGTTSAGLAFSIGLRDSSGSLSRTQVLDNAHSIVEATSLPVSADLEDGFGASPDDCAQTVRAAEQVGLCGGSIEDATGDSDKPIYSFDLAVERVRAAVAAKTRSEFLITARADNFIYGRPDLEDTIRRLQAFEAAGADVVYAPGLRDIESVKKICRSVSIPVNVVVGLCASTYTVEDLSSVGVRRISTGGSLARAALGEMIRAAQELKDCGTFEYSERAISDAAAARQMRTVVRASG
jgi:2-methylisocitrate lyase-like PEP mutase family enzyme